MGKSFDYSEYTAFVDKWSSVSLDFIGWLYSFVSEVAERTLSLTRKRQVYVEAVDTGNMLNAWKIEDIKMSNKELSFTISNSMNYASYVEWGHSARNGRWVEGRYIVTIAIDEIEKQLPSSFEYEFMKFLGDKGLG